MCRYRETIHFWTSSHPTHWHDSSCIVIQTVPLFLLSASWLFTWFINVMTCPWSWGGTNLLVKWISGNGGRKNALELYVFRIGVQTKNFPTILGCCVSARVKCVQLRWMLKRQQTFKLKDKLDIKIMKGNVIIIWRRLYDVKCAPGFLRKYYHSMRLSKLPLFEKRTSFRIICFLHSSNSNCVTVFISLPSWDRNGNQIES